MFRIRAHALRVVGLAAFVLVAAGCPEVQDAIQYELGFTEGFAQDDWYWQGFDDSYDTVDFGPIYYQGSEIPLVDSPANDAGYWDGVWQAYNDGYFVEYDYAFTIGFSEGYDAAYYADFLAFLASDQHVEYADGGWSDGYDDGFSEGRIFGAADYEAGLALDWLSALEDYRAGTDLYFEEIGLGTGAYGPVVLYGYGTDPAAQKTEHSARADRLGTGRSIRARDVMKIVLSDPPELSYRPLPQTVQDEFNVRPQTAPRTDRALTLTTTWLERINAYRAAIETPPAGAKAQSPRALSPRRP